MTTRGSKSDRRKGGIAGGQGDAGQTGRACREPIQTVGNHIPVLVGLLVLGSGKMRSRCRGQVYGAEGGTGGCSGPGAARGPLQHVGCVRAALGVNN